MLIIEPILLLIIIYLPLIHCVLYLFFVSCSISFQEEREWNLGVGTLPSLGLTVGVVIGAIFVSWNTKIRFARRLKKHGQVIPEERLLPMMLGGIMLPIGLFWFAWTSDKDITWVPQIIADIPIGMEIFMIFMQGLNYLIDMYLMFANSATAANTALRSLAAAGFPPFAAQMYHKLGVNWASTLLGFLAAAMIPVPILLYIFGKKIRAMSKLAPNLWFMNSALGYRLRSEQYICIIYTPNLGSRAAASGREKEQGCSKVIIEGARWRAREPREHGGEH